jgi:hypothetical protein
MDQWHSVISAKAEIQYSAESEVYWVPAFAGITSVPMGTFGEPLG